MPGVGGSIVNLALGGRNFPVTKDADVDRSLGGSSNEVEANGDGSARIIKTIEVWGLENVQVAIDDSRQDQEFIQALADGNDFFDSEVTYISGSVYSGLGQITGKITYSNGGAFATLSVMGQGSLTQQA